MSKNFSFQNLRGANFVGANLQRADFTGATLERANLQHADFTEADLAYADMRHANLQDADLRGVMLEGAKLEGANLDGALLDYQIEEGLLLKVARAALQKGALEMGAWHTCDTAHCIAGWAEVLSEKTRKLAATHGYEVAALLTLGHEAHKYFFASNEDARTFLQSVVAANE
jgi:hypothetical protein